MAGIKDLTNVWNNVRQIDLRPLAEQAERGVKIAIVGREGSGRNALASQMRRDPSRPSAQTLTPLLLADVETAANMVEKIAAADLIILLLDETQGSTTGDPPERTLAGIWTDSGARVLVFANRPLDEEGPALDAWIDWDRRRLIAGPVDNSGFLLHSFVPVVLDLLPAEQHLALGRHFPLFRVPIANRLINETCFSNAAYSLSTGLAEIVPVLDIPLNVTDMIVLSKNQAFLAYKLGLALGLSTRWQDYVTEFGSVLGGGFLWRQLARSLVGLIPAWGIIPKMAVAYSGTYVVGHAVLGWYLTGRHITGKQMRELYGVAFARGKRLAQDLVSKVPKPRLGRRKEPALLPETAQTAAQAAAAQAVETQVVDSPAAQVCPNCGRTSALDASFCQYCGQKLLTAG